MRLLSALACLAVFAAPATALAQPAGKPLSREALSRLIKDDSVWCAGWRQSDQSCEEVVFVEAAGDKVTQTRRYRISEEADFEMIIRQTLKLDGPRLCWTFKFAELDVVVLNDGARAPEAQSAVTMALVREKMGDLEGKLACESYVRDESTGEISSTATLDGAPAPDFDNRFRLLPPDTRVKLRALFEETEDATTT